MKLVAFCGRNCVGKTTAARYLEAYGYKRYSLAQPFKDMLAVMGLTREELYGELKMLPCELLGGQTPRHAMQTLGTEWGRELIHPEVWTMVLRRRLIMEAPALAVIDDVRYVTEANMVRGLGGNLVKICRIGVPDSPHSSETESSVITPDRIIINDNSLSDFKRDVLSARFLT